MVHNGLRLHHNLGIRSLNLNALLTELHVDSILLQLVLLYPFWDFVAWKYVMIPGPLLLKPFEQWYL